MNKLNLAILIFFVLLFGWMQMVALGQTKSSSNDQPSLPFNTQGEQEEYWAKQLFAKSYKSMNFERYNDNITHNGDVYTFDDETVTIHGGEADYSLVFENGLLYPGIINGNVKGKRLSQSELQALTEQQRVLYNLSRADSIIISAIEECKFLNPNFKQRRFKFWLSRPGSANPTVYFFELTNNKANRRTSFASFLSGSRLTFFWKGWIVI